MLEEDGHNVLLRDCLEFGVSKQDKKHLLRVLVMVAEKLGSYETLEPLIEEEWIKQLVRQEKVLFENIWEARHPGNNARIIFVIREDDSIIIAAVNKSQGSLSQAVNRGVNRWKKFLKENEQ